MGAVELLAAHETKTQTISTTALYDWDRQEAMLIYFNASKHSCISSRSAGNSRWVALESTVQQIQKIMEINGGIKEGSNLFHSFEEFSVPEGMEASFQNTVEIENIFTRVTGDSVSNINGTISAQGGANLFLMNSNGIVFGQNASINVGGSFIATTADSIQFADGTELMAKDTEAKPILTFESPTALGFDRGMSSSEVDMYEDGTMLETGRPFSRGEIVVEGGGNKIVSASGISQVEFDRRPTGISIPSNEAFALVGNGVNLKGGIITTNGGQIYLNSVNSGSVGISQTETGFTLSNDTVAEYQDINLDGQSLIDSSGTETGEISLVGKNINLDEQSFILNQNQDNSPGGSLNINAAETLSFSQSQSDLGNNIRSEALDSGEGADINISANLLSSGDFAKIRSNSFGKGYGGDINVNVSDSIQLDGSSILATTFDEGNAGNVDISSSQLLLSDIGIIASSTFGDGQGGQLNIDADIIEILGSSAVERSSISTSSFASGDAGDATIKTSQLKIADGASVSASAFAGGNAGDIIVDASELIEVSGTNPNFKSGSNPESTIRSAVQATSPSGQRALGLPATPGGNSGNLTLNTPSLNVSEQASVSVENSGSGEAGTLSINAEDVNLDDTGRITAESVSGTGGNIELNTDNLQIDNKSQITARAEDEGEGGNVTINTSNLTTKKNSQITANAEGGDGGNITIDSETILGVENSDITANAVEGDGGNIEITSDYFFGFQERPNLTQFSDVTASSEFGLSGTIEINTPETSSDEELIVSAREVEYPNYDNAFAQSCSKGRGKFTYYKAGIPENPKNHFGDREEDIPGEIQTQHRVNQRQERIRNFFGSPLPLEEPNKPRTQKQSDARDNPLGQRQNSGYVEINSKPVVRVDRRGGIPIIYADNNQIPPMPQNTTLQPNAVQINPDGQKYLIRINDLEIAESQVCVKKARIN